MAAAPSYNDPATWAKPLWPKLRGLHGGLQRGKLLQFCSVTGHGASWLRAYDVRAQQSCDEAAKLRGDRCPLHTSTQMTLFEFFLPTPTMPSHIYDCQVGLRDPRADHESPDLCFSGGCSWNQTAPFEDAWGNNCSFRSSTE